MSQVRRALMRALPIEVAGGAVHLTIERRGLPYIPKPFMRGLEPEIALVTGIRGSGKSFLRREVQQRQGNRAVLAFGEGLHGKQPGKDELKQLLGAGYAPRVIWKAVVLRACTEHPALLDKSWLELAAWLASHPSEATAILEDADRAFSARGLWAYVLFDGLEQVADSSRDRSALLRGLLELMLELRPLRKLRLKAFVHSDLLSVPEVSAFPGASKVLAAQTVLQWQAPDLFALLFSFLGNAPDPDFAADFRQQSALPWAQDGSRFMLPAELADDTERQRAVFAGLTGWADGPGLFREPYASLPGQLADARERISPGSLLLAIACAIGHAEEGSHSTSIADRSLLPPYSLLVGAARAAGIWTRVLLEEQPWAYRGLKLLAGQSVPLREAAMLRAWRDASYLPPRAEETGREPAPADYHDALEQLQRVGVVETLADGSINIPELYRVGFGLDRRGGFRLR